MSRVNYFVNREIYRSDPIPRIPDRHHVEHQADRHQEFVICGRVGRQADEVEDEKEYGHDDVRPAIYRLGQYQGQEHHQDWRSASEPRFPAKRTG